MLFWRCFWASDQYQLPWAEWPSLLLLGLPKTPQKFIMSNRNDVKCVYRCIFPWSPPSLVLSELNFVSLVLKHCLLILVFSLFREFFSFPWGESEGSPGAGWLWWWDGEFSVTSPTPPGSTFGVQYYHIDLVKAFYGCLCKIQEPSLALPDRSGGLFG